MIGFSEQSIFQDGGQSSYAPTASRSPGRLGNAIPPLPPYPADSSLVGPTKLKARDLRELVKSCQFIKRTLEIHFIQMKLPFLDRRDHPDEEFVARPPFQEDADVPPFVAHGLYQRPHVTQIYVAWMTWFVPQQVKGNHLDVIFLKNLDHSDGGDWEGMEAVLSQIVV